MGNKNKLCNSQNGKYKWPINMEAHSISLLIREIQIKITMQDHFEITVM